MIPIKFSFKGILSLALFILFIKFIPWFDDRSLWIALPIVFLIFSLGVYYVRHASQILNNRKRWYNWILNSEAENEKDIKWAGYFLIIMSVMFSIMAFFLRK